MNDKTTLRNRIFLIIVTAFFFIFPFTMFFDIFTRKITRQTLDGPKRFTEIYNLVSLKDLSNFTFSFAMIIFILSLVVAILGVIEIIRGKYYTLLYRISFSVFVVSLSLIIKFLGYYLMVALFMSIASHMFLVYYDMKTNKRMLSNSLIYAFTYLAFIIFMVVGFICVPTA